MQISMRTLQYTSYLSHYNTPHICDILRNICCAILLRNSCHKYANIYAHTTIHFIFVTRIAQYLHMCNTTCAYKHSHICEKTCKHTNTLDICDTKCTHKINSYLRRDLHTLFIFESRVAHREDTHMCSKTCKHTWYLLHELHTQNTFIFVTHLWHDLRTQNMFIGVQRLANTLDICYMNCTHKIHSYLWRDLQTHSISMTRVAHTKIYSYLRHDLRTQK